MARAQSAQFGAALYYLADFFPGGRCVQAIGAVGEVAGPVFAWSGRFLRGNARTQVADRECSGGFEKFAFIHGPWLQALCEGAMASCAWACWTRIEARGRVG